MATKWLVLLLSYILPNHRVSSSTRRSNFQRLLLLLLLLLTFSLFCILLEAITNASTSITMHLYGVAGSIIVTIYSISIIYHHILYLI